MPRLISGFRLRKLVQSACRRQGTVTQENEVRLPFLRRFRC
ncbi:hypothetical protein [Synechococcus sp. MIT S9509]|nr:hypothetical protein [Synechococcus sp. MIT S9509]